MNPQLHDEFVALCALYGAGELTDEEWALLQVHLAYCDECQLVFEQYRQLSENAIPALAAVNVDSTPADVGTFSIEDAERRLMRGLGEPASARPASPSKRRSFFAPAVFAAASILICLSVLAFYRLRHGAAQPQTAEIRQAAPSAAPPKPTVTAQPAPLPTSHTQYDSVLRAQVEQERERARDASERAARLEADLKNEQQAREGVAAQRDQLGKQISDLQAEMQKQQAGSSASAAQTAQQQGRIDELEARLRIADTELAEKDRMLSLDKEFLAHDREIRDLIGARDLYIADIFDVRQNGETAKPFGRIFYTRDRSLVFYGYDLDQQSGLKRAVTFQAWGSGEEKQNVSLGLFYQDSAHRRWVLSFHDPKTLAHLNRVFVTAEPEGGSPQPTGKPLLLAYLQVKANHP